MDRWIGKQQIEGKGRVEHGVKRFAHAVGYQTVTSSSAKKRGYWVAESSVCKPTNLPGKQWPVGLFLEVLGYYLTYL